VSPEPVGRVLRVAWLAALAGCVLTTRGLPTAASAAAVALAVAVVAAALQIPTEDEPRRRPPRAVFFAIGVALAVAAAALAAGLVRPLQKPWITLFGIPLAVAVSAFAGPLVPRRRGLALLWIVALAVGVVSTEPWSSPAGSLLFGLAALIGVGDAAFSTARAAQLEGVAPSPSSLRRALLLSAVAALLVVGGSVATYESLRPVPRLLHEREEESVAPPDRFAREPTEPAPRPQRDVALALVRAEGDAPDSGALPRPLYLRRRVLDQVRVENDFVWLSTRSGASSELGDAADGATDHRVAWPDADPRARADEPIVFKITLLNGALDELLLVAGTRWLEGDAFTVAADGAIRRLEKGAGSFTYGDAAAPARAFARVDPPTTARVDALQSELPASFDGRELMRELLVRATEGAADDFERANRIVALFRDGGVVDPLRQCDRWIDLLGAPQPRGRPIHFAQACALLARLSGMPARVVLGYRVDDFDPERRRWQVRSSQAWPWVEIGFDGAGWIDYDPTPDRLAPPRAAQSGTHAAGGGPADLGSMRAVRQSMAQTRPWWLGLGLLVAVACFLLFPNVQMKATRIGMRRTPQGVSGPARRAWRYWQELLDLCQRFELRASPALTATEFASQVTHAAPSESDAIARLLAVYHRCRFGGGDLAADDERQAKALLARLPQTLAQRRELERGRLRNRR
jgi:transglutaminase-like putative cysteine protease